MMSESEAAYAIEVTDIQELEDGGAQITFELSEEVREKLIRWAIHEMIKRTVDDVLPLVEENNE
jgi:HSP90 family molecular chaperone